MPLELPGEARNQHGLVSVGDRISSFAISYDQTLGAGRSAAWKRSRSTMMPLDNDEKLAGLPEVKFKVERLPEVIVFANGERRYGVGDEAGRILLHQSAERGLLEAVALAVERGAIGRPLGLPADGLHVSLP
jgi:hypothetical protein